MIKVCIVLLAGYALYTSGADDQSDLRREMLQGLGRKTSDLCEYQANDLVQEFGTVPVIRTDKHAKEVAVARDGLLKLALDNLRSNRKGTERIMHLAEPLEVGLRTYRGASETEGPSPRTIHLWGEIREVDSRKNYAQNIFFQLAKDQLKQNKDIELRRKQLVDLADDALRANYDEMSLMIMRVATAFDKAQVDGQMTNEVIDDLFEKAAANQLEIRKDFSPRTQEEFERMFKQISSSKLTRKFSLESLF